MNLFNIFLKRDIRTFDLDWTSLTKEELRSASEYEKSIKIKEYNNSLFSQENIYSYMQEFQRINGNEQFLVGSGIFSFAKKHSAYKNFIDIGSGYAIIPLLLGLNKDLSILSTDYNYDQIELLKKTINIGNINFECLDLFKTNFKSFKGQDVLLINGTEFGLYDKTIENINKAAYEYNIKEIWITTNHIFDWSFRRNQSYLFHILRTIFRSKSLKKGRLIGFYRSLFLLKSLFSNYCLVEKIPKFNTSQRLFIRFQLKKNLSSSKVI